MTSRIVVKNLPGWITEDKLREVFEQKGYLTDCSIKFNERGKSRRFAFIGYRTPEEAEAAINFFDNTCIGTSRVRVEKCKNLADEIQKKTSAQSAAQNTRISMLPDDLATDTQFSEFLQLHQPGGKVWQNDLVSGDKMASINKIGDDKRSTKFKETPKILESSEVINDEAIANSYAAMVKLKNVPFNASKEQIRQFFLGLDLKRIMLGNKKRKPGENAICHVEFSDPKMVDQALRRNKSFMGGKKILVTRVIRPTSKGSTDTSNSGKRHSAFPVRDNLKISADVSDSGRLYVRNLSYLCTEEDIEELFSKFGELSEIHVPLEKLTKRNKGFAFVSFLMPEHAVKALNELDGTSFQGRMLHIIPAEGKPDVEKMNENIENGGSSFKNDKEAALRQSASSSHNWNALFVGLNAIVDNVASEYGTDKKQLFEQSGAAVRMALGETEIVLKTKQFLEDHGVKLGAFGKPVFKRSKTIILAKNLPARTRAEELRGIFDKYGDIIRLVLPPTGVTGLIEFSDQNEAKAAFRALAYRRFKDVPLYLEWAPVDVFSADAPLLKDVPAQENTLDPKPIGEKDDKSDSKEATSSPPEPNLVEGQTTLFVKNLNFKTEEETLKSAFDKKFPGKIVKAIIAKNKDSHRNMMSLGYGFVEFVDARCAMEALKTMQHVELDDHKLELKISTIASKSSSTSAQKSKSSTADDQKPSTRILVRNVPFEANAKDIQELFAVFGNLRSVRLPKKAVVQAVGSVSGRSGGGRSTNLHRGFGFVDFNTVEDAKRAFDALRFSTHFYGRRLVLEWAKTDENELVEELRAKAAERAVASAAAASGVVHAGAVKRLKKNDLVASVDRISKNARENDDAV